MTPSDKDTDTLFGMMRDVRNDVRVWIGHTSSAIDEMHSHLGKITREVSEIKVSQAAMKDSIIELRTLVNHLADSDRIDDTQRIRMVERMETKSSSPGVRIKFDKSSMKGVGLAARVIIALVTAVSLGIGAGIMLAKDWLPSLFGGN